MEISPQIIDLREKDGNLFSCSITTRILHEGTESPPSPFSGCFGLGLIVGEEQN